MSLLLLLEWKLTHVLQNCLEVQGPNTTCTLPLEGIILCMRPANERWHYSVTPSLIGWAHTSTQNDPFHGDKEWRGPNVEKKSIMLDCAFCRCLCLKRYFCVMFKWYIYILEICIRKKMLLLITPCDRVKMYNIQYQGWCDDV